ncbi:short chain dehydrogenase [Macroventuria anomochaeta]|uniref:Short chain dehydrogenase n=1 Tax=Macroventuria anomochaeta TaxID=301207 RepID=A0ACB6S4N0_9PLEO|nr:short chain dehydrogenase [Macroventuria anomochaeta]KAF2628164.1 short chain dehydrogenase [Macroventuria anomochaeta]
MSRYAEAHKLANLRGAGDARPTALQVIQDEGLTGRLTDKVFLITGVSSGIGIETLRALHTTGAHVYGTVRDLAKGQKVVDAILSEAHPSGGKITLIEMSLDSFASIRSGAADFLSMSNNTLHLLVANAGIMATPYGKTVDGFETQFATNHLSHFLLFQLLKPALLASATPSYPSRVVSVSSTGHILGLPLFDDYNFESTPYDPWRAYGQSKTSNIWFANSIERHFGSQNLHATSVHPGLITASNLGTHLPDDQQAMFYEPEVQRTAKSVQQGAATQVWAAVGKEWASKGGRYLSGMAEALSNEEKAKEEGMHYMANDGYQKWAYDGEGAERLWRESLGLVGIEAE